MCEEAIPRDIVTHVGEALSRFSSRLLRHSDHSKQLEASRGLWDNVQDFFFVAKTCREIREACQWVSYRGSRMPAWDRTSVPDMLVTLMTYCFEEASKQYVPLTGNDDGKVRLHFAALSNIDPE